LGLQPIELLDASKKVTFQVRLSTETLTVAFSSAGLDLFFLRSFGPLGVLVVRGL